MRLSEIIRGDSVMGSRGMMSPTYSDAVIHLNKGPDVFNPKAAEVVAEFREPVKGFARCDSVWAVALYFSGAPLPAEKDKPFIVEVFDEEDYTELVEALIRVGIPERGYSRSWYR